MAVHVNVDNFRAAETARMCDGFVQMAGGVNAWAHFRAPTPVEHQPVIRMNRDTLYSIAVVDLSEGATVSLPDAGDRYVSAMVVNAEHYINQVLHAPGPHELTVATHGSRFVAVAVRIFTDPNDPADVAAVNTLQDQLVIEAGAAGPYEHPDFDETSLTATHDALLALGAGLQGSGRMFGTTDHVEPTRHLIGTALGWGGLPESEAIYFIEGEPKSAGRYTLALQDVPTDAFWSVSVYNRDGYFEPNEFGTYSLNSVTATPEADGSVVVSFAPDGAGLANHLYVMDGWNYALRLYRPRPEVVGGTWSPPKAQPIA
jgi:hypothetical protein